MVRCGPMVIVLRHAAVDALRADALANLRKLRVFVLGASADGAEARAPCELAVVHPDSGVEVRLSGHVVYVKPDEPGMGVGLELDPFPFDELLAFVDTGVAAPAELIPVEDDAPGLDELIPVGEGDELVPVGEGDELLPVDDEEPSLGDSDASGEVGAADEHDEHHEHDGTPRGEAAARNVQERIRRLSLSEQQRTARTGNLNERIALERAFGPAVWEALLSNGRITVPEVARIAKKGTLPKPLVEAIATNGTWVGTPEVQRALLSNPRSSAVVVGRVLRALSRTELARVPQQTAYPLAVRQAAKRMMAG